ncbi:MAG: hypothetical protein WCD18_00665, partial [Thermosynechococcaceae cyanobacterium]
SGLGRLCGVSHKAIEPWITTVSVGTSPLPKCLEPLRGKPVELELRGKKNSRLLIAPFCAGMIEYYAFEARVKKAEALFTYRKFATMGIERWIQDITGWKPPEIQAPEEKEILLPDLNFSRNLIQTLTQNQLSPTAYRLCLHLHKVGQLGERPTVAKLCKDLEISRPTFHKTIRCLNDLDVLPNWFEIETRNYPERIVRDWLHSELGGQIEAPTPYGPIDLLTDDSVIEVKAVENWKEAIGHVLVKALKHPDHDPCLMLFSDRIRNFQPIRECCEAFGIILGFQLIQYAYDETDELLAIERVKVFL